MSATFLDLALRFNGREVFTAVEAPSAASESQRTLSSASRSFSAALHATSTPKLDKPLVSLALTLSGATTINLAAIAALALPGSATRTIDLTGARPKVLLLRAGDENHADGITIAPGASNGYDLFGNAAEPLLLPGEIIVKAFAGVESTLPAVAAGVRTLDITPGAADDELFIELYAGT